MTDPKKKEKRPEVEAPYVPEFEVPDPPVPNRAHTEMSVKSGGPTAVDPLGNFETEHNTLGNFENEK